ncbi:hypothetical protein QFC21_001454 [Naganishia friedmannii]|uniref:Uncharacterized protein n=1 Tax=Naganishia friedmannii TaxID=89922 RepID=A0ACC2W4Y2_9TREE|nr:hypothetical protein QFC21_001454 [Naganishia friedmannii]
MVNNPQHNGDSEVSSSTNKSVNPKPGWRMLSSTDVPALHALNRGNGNSSKSNAQQISTRYNAVASSSKNVLPMHSLIETAPSPLPFIYPDTRTGSSQTSEYVSSGALVQSAPAEGTGSSTAGVTLPTVPSDGRTLCVRHQMMADQDVNGKLQKSLDTLPVQERAAITALWSTFSSSPHLKRKIILEGILTMCCFSQLSHLSEALSQIIRVDPFTLFPREVCLRVLGYLDAISLGKAAQVSKLWKGLADDDLLWRRMCGQHIERKCTKCGWGLPLLERRRLRKELNLGAPDRMMVALEHDDHDHEHEDVNRQPVSPEALGTNGHRMVSLPRSFNAQIMPESGTLQEGSATGTTTSITEVSTVKRPATCTSSSRKRRRVESSTKPKSGASEGSSDSDATPAANNENAEYNSAERDERRNKKPWKHVYCERLIVERNWRKGRYTERTLKGHTNGIMCLQFHQNLSTPSYPVLITGSYDRTVRVWNLDTGETVRVLQGHTRAVRALQFDQVMLITGSMDRTLKVWNWRTGECVRTLEGHTDGVVCLNYNKGTLASGSADAVIKIWNIATGDCYALRGHQGWVNSVLLWDGKGSPSEQSVQDASPSTSAQPSGADSKSFLFSASDDGTIKLWDLQQRACIKTFVGHTGHVQSLKLLIVEKEHEEDDNEITPNRTAMSNFSAAAFTPSDTGLMSCYSPSARTFGARSFTSNDMNMRSGYEHDIAREPSNNTIFNLDDDNKEAILVSAGLDNMIKIWDAETGIEKRTLFGHIEGVWGIDIDALRLASGSHDRTIKIWDPVTSLQLSDDLLISGSDDGEIRVWNFGPQTTSTGVTPTATGPTIPSINASIMRSTN